MNTSRSNKSEAHPPTQDQKANSPANTDPKGAPRGLLGCLTLIFVVLCSIPAANLFSKYSLGIPMSGGPIAFSVVAMTIILILPLVVARRGIVGRTGRGKISGVANGFVLVASAWLLVAMLSLPDSRIEFDNQNFRVLYTLNQIRNVQWDQYHKGELVESPTSYLSIEELLALDDERIQGVRKTLENGSSEAYVFTLTLSANDATGLPGYECTAIPRTKKGKRRLRSYSMDETTLILNVDNADPEVESIFSRLEGQPESGWNRDAALELYYNELESKTDADNASALLGDIE